MKEAYQKFVSMCDESFFTRIAEEYNISSIKDEQEIFRAFLDHRDEIYNKYFSFLDPYKDDPQFIELFNFEEEKELFSLVYGKVFVGDELYHNFLRKYVKSESFDPGNTLVLDMSDYEFLSELGLSDEEISEMTIFSREVINFLCEKNPDLVETFIERNPGATVEYAVREYLNGNKDVLDYYDDSYNRGPLINFLSILADYKIDARTVVEDILPMLEDANPSLITDMDVARKMVTNWGSLALIFVNNPTPEIVELAGDFPLNDYIQFEGTYKDSPSLVLKFMRSGKTGALYHANSPSISDEVIEAIRELEIPVEDLTSSENLSKNVKINKFLVEQGNYSCVSDIREIDSLETFEFLYDLYANKGITLNYLFGLSKEHQLVYCVAKNDFSDSHSLYDIKIPKDVTNRLIDCGMTLELFAKHVSRYDMLAECLFERGVKGALFFSDDYSYIEKHLDDVTYEDFLSVRGLKEGKFKLSYYFVEKFIKEGHYDFIDEVEFPDYNITVESLGFSDLTYDQYMALPEGIRNIPCLKKKFLDADPELLEELLENDPDSDIVKRALLGGVDPNRILRCVDEHYISLSAECVLLFVEKGCLDAVRHYSRHFNEKGNDILKKIVEVYMSKSGGKAPEISEYPNELETEFIKYFLAQGDYSILSKVVHLDKELLDIVLNSGYNIETFKKNPINDANVIVSLLNPETEPEIFDVLMSMDTYMSDFVKVIIKYIDDGLDKEHLKKLTSKFYFTDYDVLFDKYNGRELEFLPFINRKNLYSKSPIYLDRVLSIISPDDLIEDLNDYSLGEKERIIIIRKMVMRGRYDFVKYYNKEIDDEILKRAIMSGEIPAHIVGADNVYRMHLQRLSFTPEELDYLRSKIKDFPMVFLFLPEILNNVEALAEAISKNPEAVSLIKPELLKNPALLTTLVKTNPEIVSRLVAGQPKEVLVDILKANPAFVEFIDKYRVDRELVDAVVEVVPNIIDKGFTYDTNLVVKALKSGYVFNDNTTSFVAEVALMKGFDVPIEFFAHNLDVAFHTALNSNIFDALGEEKHIEFFSHLFEYLKKVNENDFYYLGSKIFFNSRYGSNEKMVELFESFGLYDPSYSYYIFDSKETFLVYRYIRANNITIDNIDSLESFIDTSEDKLEILRVILNSFSNDYNNPKYFSFQRRIAKKYFRENPEEYANYVDPYDSEVVQIAVELMDTYPDLYKKIKGVLKDKANVLRLFSMGKNPFPYLEDEMNCDLEIIQIALDMDLSNVDYIDRKNEEVKKFLVANFDKYPSIFKIYPELLVSKEIILKCMDYEQGLVYNYISDEFKQDFDICMAYISFDPNRILYLDKTMPIYQKLLFEAIKLNPEIFTNNYYVQECITQEMYEYVLDKIEDAFVYLPDSLQTIENFNKMTLVTSNIYQRISIDKLFMLIENNAIDFSNEEVCSNILFILLNHPDLLKVHMTPNVLKIFKSGSVDLESNDQIFKSILGLGTDFDYSIFGAQYQEVFKNAITILNATGKINTVAKNPIFGFDVCKYIYPLFGLEFTLNIIKYNTPAAGNIVAEIKNGNSQLLLEYYDFIKKANIFDNDDKFVHFAFRDFACVRDLVVDLLNHKDILSQEDYETFGKVVANKNYYKINSLVELRKYNEITLETANQMLQSDDINAIKAFICQLLGITMDNLKQCFVGFQLDNFEKLSYLRNEVREKLGEEKTREIWSKYFYTKEDVKLIIFLKRVIYSNNLQEIKDLMKLHLDDQKKGIDLISDFDHIIDKIRYLYNLEFNLKMSKPEELEGKRLEKDDPSNPHGVTIIDMNGGEFRFLAHRLYSYDSSNHGFQQMLMDDPSLWTKLEGASTLSTSCFSHQGFWFLNAGDPGGVVYLFSELPDQFMLFMYGRDLYVEHGGYKLEPTARSNCFSDIDGLIQSSHYHHGTYNEVAGFREGMIPSAIACTSPPPSDAQIRAAKYFSQLTGKDVPIIVFNIPEYDRKKNEEFVKNKEAYASSFDISLIPKIIINGVDRNVTDLIDNVNYCFETMKNKYQSGEIGYEVLIRHLSELTRSVNRLDNTVPEIQKLSRRIAIYRKSILALASLTPDQVIRLENAGLGESGIMYRLETDDGKYLVKPAVEKASFESQPFRAEIQASASVLQQMISPDTSVSVEAISRNNISLSKQELLELDPEKKDYLERWASTGGELDDDIKRALLQEYVVDFLLCNFDCFAGNFVIDSSGSLRGIDKEQSFRFIDQPESLRADFSYIPNGSARIPIYKILFDRYRKNEISLDLSVIADTIDKAKEIPMEEYREMFKKYAYQLKGKEAEAFLDKICERRELAIQKMEEFLLELDPDFKRGVGL